MKALPKTLGGRRRWLLLLALTLLVAITWLGLSRVWHHRMAGKLRHYADSPHL